MNLLQMLGGQWLWAGSEDSLMQLTLALITDEFDRMRAEAERERTEFFKRRDAYRAERLGKLGSVTAALTSAGVTLNVASEADAEAEQERKAFSSAPLTVLDNGVGIIKIHGGLVNSDA